MASVAQERQLAKIKRFEDKITYNYNGYDSGVKVRLTEIAKEVKAKQVQAICEVGRRLSEAHGLMSGHDSDQAFGAWVQSECGISRSSAYNYMRAWDMFGQCASLAHFTAEAMYKLAAPAAPEKAAEKALELAEKGERITASKAKKLIDEHTADGGAPKGELPRVLSPSFDAQGSGSTPPPPPTPEDLCPQGGEHDYDAEACTKCHEPVEASAPEPVVVLDEKGVGKNFTAMLDLLAKSVRLLDEINNARPHQRMYQSIKDSLDLAYDDVRAYRKVVKA